MTKAKASTIFKKLIDSNQVNMETIEWIERANGLKVDQI